MSSPPARALYVEIEPYCVAWLRNLISRGLIADGDVADFSLTDLRPTDLARYTQVHFCAGIGLWSIALRRGGVPDSRPVWTASLPCQPFSAAGKGDGFADERHLWPEFFHLVEQCRPEIILGEQVASKDGLTWLDLVQSDLEGTGYAVGSVDSCSAGFGAPHIRQRMYWMATKPLDHAADPRRYDAREHGSGPPLQSARPVEHGASERLAHADPSQWRTDATGGHERDGDDAGRPQGTGDIEGRGEPGQLGDPRGTGLAQQRCDTGASCEAPSGDSRQAAIGTDASVGVVGQPHIDGREPRRSPGETLGLGCSVDAAGCFGVERPGPTNGFWSDCDWIFCRDGKWRPVEPGTFPLAHGLPRSMGTGGAELRRLASVAGLDAKSLARAKEYRIGTLRAYGNAINLEHATEFCRAALG